MNLYVGGLFTVIFLFAAIGLGVYLAGGVH